MTDFGATTSTNISAHGRNDEPAPRSISQLAPIRLGGTEQWIRIQGRDTSNPVLLFIQQGPGFPMVNEAADDHKLWHLEDDFVVVYWDQRGCGKSFSPAIPPESITVEQLIEDTNELIEALAQRFRMEHVYVVGLSFGGTIALLTAARYPEHIRAVVGVDPDVQFDLAERFAYDFALQEATRRSNRRALRALRRLGPPPHLNSKRFGTRARWATNFGGVHRQASYTGLLLKSLRQMMLSPDYSLADILRTLRGMRLVQDQLLPRLAHLDLFEMLPRLEVPVFLMQGRHDKVAPPACLEQYFQALRASRGKRLIWFDESAHMPQYEEASTFRATLLAIKRLCEAESTPPDLPL